MDGLLSFFVGRVAGDRLGPNPALPAAVLSQIETLQAEKEARTPTQRKVGSQLLYEAKKKRGEHLGAGLEKMEERVKLNAGGLELVDITGDVTPALLAEIGRLGGSVVASAPRYREIRARLPLEAVEKLAARVDVSFVQAARLARTNVGSVQSEGDVAHRADQVRSTLKATGRNVKIGVLSDSVDFLTGSQATGDLGPVTVLPGQAGLGNTGEGTAMLEIVHDLAPDAQLYFATAFNGIGSFAQNITDLRNAGCDIIIDDVGYFAETPFQDGPIAGAVNDVVNDGALYFSAAGNDGNLADGTSSTWEGDFVDGGPAVLPILKGGRLQKFGAQSYDTITVGTGVTTLAWSDPAGKSQNDYDLYVLDATGTTVVAASTDLQNGGQDPFEIVSAGNTNERIVVWKADAAQARYLRVTNSRGQLAVSTASAVYGHAAAERAVAVAAVDASAGTVFTSSFNVETFSSDGSRRIFYNSDGTPVTPGNFLSSGGLLRQKPQVAAADGVTTSVPGFAPFYGTSAAAPHAGAIAGLVWSRNRTLTNTQVLNALTSTAIDIATPGIDPQSGSGLLNALAAANSVTGKPIIALANFSITGESYSPANGHLDPGEMLTASLLLRNDGPVSTSNLTAALAAVNGVTNPSGAQSYGAISPGGTVGRTFTFQGNASVGQTVTAMFNLSDGGQSAGTISVDLLTGTVTPTTFTNSAAITINDDTDATPFPSNVTVSGITATTNKVTAKLMGFGHTFPADVDVILVSPAGTGVMLIGGAGSGGSVSNLTLTFDDSGGVLSNATLATGTYHPGALLGEETVSFTSPAPAAPYGLAMANFLNDATPNGIWKLFVRDTAGGDVGNITSGYSVTVTTASGVNSGVGADVATALSADQTNIRVGDEVVFTAKVINYGTASAVGVTLTDTMPLQLTAESVMTSKGTASISNGTVTANLGTMASNASATVTIYARAVGTGSFGNTATATLSGTDLNPANNSNSVPLDAGKPNLVVSQPVGWSNKLVVSNVTGTNTDSPTIFSTDSLFVDLAYTNTGSASTPGDFHVDLYLDGTFLRQIDHETVFQPGATRAVQDVAIGSVPGGVHTLQVVIDADGQVDELNKADNTFSRTFSVIGVGPNLAPFTPAGASGPIVIATSAGASVDSLVINSTDTVLADISLINNGTTSTGVASTADIYLDGTVIGHSNTPILTAGQSSAVTDFSLGTLAPGTHTLRVVLDSGGVIAEVSETDNDFSKTFRVNAVPVISGIQDLSINEDTATPALGFTVMDAETPSSNLVVSVISSNPALAPSDNVVISGNGINRTVTVTPLPNTFGSTTITLQVDDGTGGKSTTSFKVTVISVDDAPAIGKISDVTLNEDNPAGPVYFDLSDIDTPTDNLTVSVTSSNQALLPDGNLVVGGSGATRSLSFTPALNAFGTATLTVTVQDGDGGMITEDFKVTVNSVNDLPVIGPISNVVTDEDTPSGAVPFTVSDVETAAGALTLSAVSSNQAVVPVTGITFGGSDGARTVMVSPAPNAFGNAVITVTVADGDGGTASTQFMVAVNSVNDLPVIGAIFNVTTQEDTPTPLLPFNVSDVETPADLLMLSAGSSNPSVIPVANVVFGGSGALRTVVVTPAPNVSGASTITVSLMDSDGGTTTRDFTVTVGPVNDAPTFTLGGDLKAALDAGPQEIMSFATNISPGPADEAAQTVTFLAVAAEPGLFSAQPAIDASGKLTFTPSPIASGESAVIVTAVDSEGGVSAPQSFTIAVTSFAEETGTYNGLAIPAALVSNDRAGMITVSFDTTGKATGKLTLGGTAYAFKGLVTNSGQVLFGGKTPLPSLALKRKGLSSLSLELQLDVSDGTGLVTGTIKDGSNVISNLTAEKTIYSKAHPAPGLLVGAYAVLFPARTPANQGLPATAFPQGDGIGTLTVDAFGKVKLVGTLADGSKVSVSNLLSVFNHWPFFAATDGKKGSISGFVHFTETPGISDAAGVNLLWLKPANSKAKFYPAGWSGLPGEVPGIQTDLLVSRFAGVAGIFDSLSAVDGDGNVQLTLTDGGLADPGILKALNLSSAGKFTVVAPASDKVTLTAVPKTGLVTGKFQAPGVKAKSAIHAVAFPKQNVISGFFLGASESGNVNAKPEADPVSQ